MKIKQKEYGKNLILEVRVRSNYPFTYYVELVVSFVDITFKQNQELSSKNLYLKCLKKIESYIVSYGGRNYIIGSRERGNENKGILGYSKYLKEVKKDEKRGN